MDTLTLVIIALVVIAIIAALLVWRSRRGGASGGAPSASRSAPAVKTTGKLEITSIHHGVVADEGEWVMLVSNDYEPVQLEGWKLTDEGARHSYVFPAVSILPGGQLRVHMWDGENTGRDLYVGRRQHWWNNDGDTAYLYDAQGELIHSLAYGPAPASAPATG